MSRHAIVCSPDEPYEHVLQTMEQHQIRRVPVVDRTGRLVGIVLSGGYRLASSRQKADCGSGPGGQPASCVNFPPILRER
jgi:CBS-domain-containing membrane protein